MTTFLSPNKQGDADYNIFYFSPNGTRVDLCGHATLVATNALLERRGNAQVKYRLDPNFYSENKIMNGYKIDEETQIIFPIQKSNQKNHSG